MENKGAKKMLCAIQWQSADWVWLGEIARSAGMSRSAFVRSAALAAATATANGISPYFVNGGAATTQNTRINNSEPLSKAKGGGVVDACDRRRRRGVAKGADDPAKKKRGPQA